jgi:tetratricopeptide (TPR) repeat protein
MHGLKNADNRPSELVAKADQLYQGGWCDAAVDMLLAGIKRHPADESLYYALAEMLIDSDQYQDAYDLLKDLSSPIGNIRALELSAYCQFGLGRFNAAEAIADQILNVDPKSAPALNLKGLVAFKQSNKNTAEQFFRKAIAVNPEYGKAYTHLGMLGVDASNMAEAIAYYEKGFSLAPTATQSVLGYHTAVQAQGAYERAEPFFKKALQQYPLNKRLVYLLVDIFLQQSKFEQAMQAIENAILAFGFEDGILAAALNVRERLGPMSIDASVQKQPSVSLCMIAKNEEKYLANCLASARAVVDEIIVVDTGSTDQTKDIASVFGARVFDFKWRDNFSEARNFSISKARGDWILILDADEVVSARDSAYLHDIIDRYDGAPCAFSIVTRNYTMQANTIGWVANEGRYPDEEAGAGWIPSEKVRLFKNDGRIQFEYPIHEIVDPCLKRLGIPIRTCDFVIHHYGKLNQLQKSRKSRTYYAIGRKKLAELGDNRVALRELAIQAGHLQKHDEAIDLWQRYIKLKPDDAEAFVNLGSAYFNLGSYDQAATSAQQAMKLAPELKEAHFNYAISQLHMGNASKAIAVFENILKKHSRYPSAEFMLAAAYCCDGQKSKALTVFEKIRRTDVGPALAVTFGDLAQRMSSANQADYAVALLETAVSGNMANDSILRLLKSLGQKNENSS